MIYGLDIGGTKTEISIFDDQLDHQDSWRQSTVTDCYDGFLDMIASMVQEADRRTGVKGMVGFGIPGVINADGKTLSANIAAANGQRVGPDLSDRLARQVTGEKDIRCFALSEAWVSRGKKQQTVFGAIVGTGVSGCLVVNGNLLTGRQGIAGEFGHSPVPATLARKFGLPEFKCGCGLNDCVEGFISGPGMVRLHRHFGHEASSPDEILECMADGNARCLITFAAWMELLGATFAQVVKMHDPDLIVMGGGLSLADQVVEELPAAIEAQLFPGFRAPPVRRAAYGDSSGARGAAILALQAANS